METLSLSEQKAVDRIFSLFPMLSLRQKEQILELNRLYREWNNKINLISRRDIDNLYSHHILHSLGITKVIRFRSGSRIIDVGTGGGFPGIPLAILFPESSFILVDSTAKKVGVCKAITSSLELKNVSCHHCRIEDFHDHCHFVVSRAAMPLGDLERRCRHLFLQEQRNALPNGIIALKGGNLTGEVAPYKNRIDTEELHDYLCEDYYAEKKVLYLPMTA